MALTLLEASKKHDGNVKRAAVIEMFAANSDLLRVLPFEDIPGGSYSYNQEGKLPGVAFRGFNEAYSESVGMINPQVEVLKIAGGDLDVDKAIIKTRGEDQRTSQEAMKVKAMSLYLTGKIVNGNSATQPREFDGLRVRIAGYQLLPALSTSASANSPLSLEALDAAIDHVDNPTHLVMSKEMRRKLTVAARNYQVGGFIEYTVDEFGKRVTVYNDLPILIADYDDTGTKIIDFNEAGPAGGSTVTSVYVLSVGSGMLSGLQNGVMEVNDLGELQTKPVLRTRVEWLVGLAALHGRCASRVWGITNAAVTA
jgi:hypothetical protein